LQSWANTPKIKSVAHFFTIRSAAKMPKQGIINKNFAFRYDMSCNKLSLKDDSYWLLAIYYNGYINRTGNIGNDYLLSRERKMVEINEPITQPN
jgi:hypothetical protein